MPDFGVVLKMLLYWLKAPTVRSIPAKASGLGIEDEKEEALPDSPHRPDSGPFGPESGRGGDGKKLLLIGLSIPWALPKAGMGRAFGPKTRLDSVPSPWNPEWAFLFT